VAKVCTATVCAETEKAKSVMIKSIIFFIAGFLFCVKLEIKSFKSNG
jgi:hypothetical protein